MFGTVQTLTPATESGTIQGGTPPCTYTFDRAHYFSDWEDLVIDFANGDTIYVNYLGKSGTAVVVRRSPTP